MLAGCGGKSDTPESEQAATSPQAPAPAKKSAPVYRFTEENAGEAKARLGTQYRTVLAMPRQDENSDPPAAASYTSASVTIPQQGRLEFGIGVLPEKDEAATAVTFSVSVKIGDATHEIYSRELNTADFAKPFEAQWIEGSVDVGQWAGQQATFSFFASSTGGALYPAARWAAPLLFAAIERPKDTPPNLLLISLDTLRADHLSAYGYNRETSPKLDAFAKQAFLFEECIAPSSWTLPSHATMLTGLPPAVHGAYVFTKPRVRHSLTTLSELARDAGYFTAAFTEGAYVGGQLGFNQGFDIYSNGLHSGALPHGTAQDTLQHGLDWMAQHQEQPFFMFLHTYEIHWPYIAPDKYANKFTSHPIDPVQFTEDIGKNDFSGNGFMVMTTDPGKRQDVIDLYDGGISHVDAMLGEFFTRMDAMGLLENTIIVVTSDHGEGFWEHRVTSHGTVLYREMLHVPLIIRLPGKNPPSGRISHLVALADIFPTVLEQMGLQHPANPDAFNLKPLMDGVAGYPRTVVTSHLTQEQLNWTMLAVQTNDGKYIATTHLNAPESPLFGYWTPTRGFEPGIPEDILMTHLMAGGRDWWITKTEEEEKRHKMFLSAREELFVYPADKIELVDLFYEKKDRPEEVTGEEIENFKKFRGLMAGEVSQWKSMGATMHSNEPIKPLSEDERNELRALGYIQ